MRSRCRELFQQIQLEATLVGTTGMTMDSTSLTQR